MCLLVYSTLLVGLDYVPCLSLGVLLRVGIVFDASSFYLLG
jgi:hypothetical protein